MTKSLTDRIEELKTQFRPWEILNDLEKDLIKQFKEDKHVDIISSMLITQGLDESDLNRYLKKTEDICTEIENDIPNILQLSHYDRGRAIFDRLSADYTRDKDENQYKLTGVIDAGIGNCVSLSGLTGGIMQRFGLDVVFRDFLSSPGVHVNTGLICGDEDEKLVVTVEPNYSNGYDVSDFVLALILPGYRHHGDYDARLLCAENMAWRTWEYEENPPIDDILLLRFQLLQHEFVAERAASLFNIAVYLYNIKTNPELNVEIESDVELMTGLLEYALWVDPNYERAYEVLQRVKESWD